MTMTSDGSAGQPPMHFTSVLVGAVRCEFHRLVHLHGVLTTDEGMDVPTWLPCPRTVHGRGAAPAALWATGERLGHATSRRQP